ncbi:MAG: zf-HC2 domain-containing protein [Planctomycetota bacterium]
MKCEDFQMLLADALGGELSDADRPAFQAHLAQCAPCRAEYESMSRAVRSLQALPEPRAVSVRRVGDRLILSESPPRTLAWLSHGLLRYAASVLIAFTAGYALRAGLTPHEGKSGTTIVRVADAGSKRDSLQVAIAGAHLRNPGRSDLAKCLMAMYDVRR